MGLQIAAMRQPESRRLQQKLKTSNASFSEAKTMGRDDFQAAAEVSPRLCLGIENAQFAVFRFLFLFVLKFPKISFF